MPSHPAESSSSARIGAWRRVLALWPPSKHEVETEDHPLLDRHTPTSPTTDQQGFLSSIFGSTSGARTGSRGIFSPPTRAVQAWAGLPIEDPPDYSGDEEDVDDPGDTSTAAAPLPPPNTARKATRRFDPIIACLVFISVGWTVGVFLAYPFPTTIHVFIGILVFMFGWTLSNWIRLVVYLGSSRKNAHLSYSNPGKVVLAITSILVIIIAIWGFRIPEQEMPDLPAQKYFIGANLHNNEEVLGQWSDQLEKLIFHRKSIHRSPLTAKPSTPVPQLMRSRSRKCLCVNIRVQLGRQDQDVSRHAKYDAVESAHRPPDHRGGR